MNTMYMHYRKINDETGEIEPRGGATVAIRETSPGVIAASMAICRKDEVFNKKLGRTIAEGRLQANLASRPYVTKHWFMEMGINPGQRGVKSLVADQVAPIMQDMDFY